MNQRYPSALLENAVNELASLPGVGRKTALRLALYMLRRDVGYTENFAAALVALRRDVKYCKVCHNICDDEVCSICANPSRDHSLVCVVENIKEVMAIENTGQFRGVYHVLGGIISPMSSRDSVSASLSSRWIGTLLSWAFSMIFSARIPLPLAMTLGASSEGSYSSATACFTFFFSSFILLSSMLF